MSVLGCEYQWSYLKLVIVHLWSIIMIRRTDHWQLLVYVHDQGDYSSPRTHRMSGRMKQANHRALVSCHVPTPFFHLHHPGLYPSSFLSPPPLNHTFVMISGVQGATSVPFFGKPVHTKRSVQVHLYTDPNVTWCPFSFFYLCKLHLLSLQFTQGFNMISCLLFTWYSPPIASLYTGGIPLTWLKFNNHYYH